VGPPADGRGSLRSGARAAVFKAQIERIRGEAETALGELGRSTGPNQSTSELRAYVQGFWSNLESVLDWAERASPARGFDFIQREVVRQTPRRLSVEIEDDGCGSEATAQILRRSPSTAVLILSMHSDERYVVRAIEAVHAGKTFFSPAVAKVLSGRDTEAPRSQEVEDRYDLLTEREREIYQLLAEGESNKEIASLLCLSLHTVETHRTRGMDKLGLHSAAELVLSAVRRGLVGLP
jgi:two-component system, NarL family, response regulator NreC